MVDVLVVVLNLFALALIARVVLGWFVTGPDAALAPVVGVLERTTEPVVGPVRRLVPRPGGFDPSIFLVFIFVRWLLVPALQGGW